MVFYFLKIVKAFWWTEIILDYFYFTAHVETNGRNMDNKEREVENAERRTGLVSPEHFAEMAQSLPQKPSTTSVATDSTVRGWEPTHHWKCPKILQCRGLGNPAHLSPPELWAMRISLSSFFFHWINVLCIYKFLYDAYYISNDFMW